MTNKGNNKITEHRTFSSKGKVKTHESINTKSVNNRETGKPQWPGLGTGISKEMVD